MAAVDSAVSLVLSHAVSQGRERKDIYPIVDAQTYNVQIQAQIEIALLIQKYSRAGIYNTHKSIVCHYYSALSSFTFYIGLVHISKEAFRRIPFQYIAKKFKIYWYFLVLY